MAIGAVTAWSFAVKDREGRSWIDSGTPICAAGPARYVQGSRSKQVDLIGAEENCPAVAAIAPFGPKPSTAHQSAAVLTTCPTIASCTATSRDGPLKIECADRPN